MYNVGTMVKLYEDPCDCAMWRVMERVVDCGEELWYLVYTGEGGGAHHAAEYEIEYAERV